MKIHLERSHCELIGMCEATADDYFEIGDDDVVDVLREDVDPGDADRVRAATEACPVMALSLRG